MREKIIIIIFGNFVYTGIITIILEKGHLFLEAWLLTIISSKDGLFDLQIQPSISINIYSSLTDYLNGLCLWDFNLKLYLFFFLCGKKRLITSFSIT